MSDVTPGRTDHSTAAQDVETQGGDRAQYGMCAALAGLGILLLVLGLILLFAIKEFPDSLQEVVDPTTVGWILVIAGVLALARAASGRHDGRQRGERGGSPCSHGARS